MRQEPAGADVAIVLETQRLILRPWALADLEAFQAICSDPRVMQLIGDGQIWSAEQMKIFIEWSIIQWHDHGYCRWPLILKDDGSLIGFCGFLPAEDGAEIGWRLAFQHWGKGLA